MACSCQHQSKASHTRPAPPRPSPPSIPTPRAYCKEQEGQWEKFGLCTTIPLGCGDLGGGCCPYGNYSVGDFPTPFCWAPNVFCAANARNISDTECRPLPVSPRDCGAPGRNCCPSAYGLVTDKELPPLCQASAMLTCLIAQLLTSRAPDFQPLWVSAPAAWPEACLVEELRAMQQGYCPGQTTRGCCIGVAMPAAVDASSSFIAIASKAQQGYQHATATLPVSLPANMPPCCSVCAGRRVLRRRRLQLYHPRRVRAQPARLRQDCAALLLGRRAQRHRLHVRQRAVLPRAGGCWQRRRQRRWGWQCAAGCGGARGPHLPGVHNSGGS